MANYELITDDHVKATIKADKGDLAKLISWETEDFTKKGDHYASSMTSIKVVYEIEGKRENASYVAKMNMGESEFKDYADFLVLAFLKEIDFLGKIVPEMNTLMTSVGLQPLQFAKLFHSSTAKYNELLVMEDLRKRGFKLYDRSKGLDFAHTELVVKEVARLHAASLLLQDKAPNANLGEIFPRLNLTWHNHSETADNLFNLFFSSGMETASKMLMQFDGYDKPKKWLQDYKENPCQVFRKHAKRNPKFDVISHGDCWNNNFLFRYDDNGTPVEVILVDLQLSCLASAANDLNYLFYTSLTGHVRKPNLNSFLKVYHDTFCSTLQGGKVSPPFTYEELLQEFRERNEYGLLFAVGFADALVRQSEDLPDMDVKSEEEMRKLMEDFNEKAMKTLDTNPLFKDRFLAVFDEMIENGVFE